MTTHPLRVLWLQHLDYNYGIEHGAHLRLFNYARHLRESGHEVYFAVPIPKDVRQEKRLYYLRSLKEKNIISDYFEIQYRHPRLLGKLARLLIAPALSRFVLQGSQQPIISRIEQLIRERQINLFIIGDRGFLFVLPVINRVVACIIDWCDSNVLLYRRQRQILFQQRRFVDWLESFRPYWEAWLEEHHYSKYCSISLVASPVDKQCLDQVSGAPEKSRVLMNGVELPKEQAVANKIKNRLIFSGNMDFPPNYESALWFIRNVLPLLLKENPKINFVVAGANPVEELKGLQGNNVEVTGFVEDIRQEIARSILYVAPMVCGGGFKNKVVEAITSGTYVVATSIAVEFLSAELQKQLLVADQPQDMAKVILSYLNKPLGSQQLQSLQYTMSHEFSWKRRTEELISIASDIID